MKAPDLHLITANLLEEILQSLSEEDFEDLNTQREDIRMRQLAKVVRMRSLHVPRELPEDPASYTGMFYALLRIFGLWGHQAVPVCAQERQVSAQGTLLEQQLLSCENAKVLDVICALRDNKDKDTRDV